MGKQNRKIRARKKLDEESDKESDDEMEDHRNKKKGRCELVFPPQPIGSANPLHNYLDYLPHRIKVNIKRFSKIY